MWSKKAFQLSAVITTALLIVILLSTFLYRTDQKVQSLSKAMEKLKSAQVNWQATTDKRVKSARRTLANLLVRLGELEKMYSQARSGEGGESAPGKEDIKDEIARIKKDLQSIMKYAFEAQEAGNALALNPDALLLPDREIGGGIHAHQPVTSKGSNPEALNWSAGQVCGEPDTMTGGDHATAWASQEPDGGIEWIEADFDEAVDATAVLVRETFNPGAVVRIEVLDENGKRYTLWKGDDPTRESPGELVVEFPEAFRTGSIKVVLDTRKVPGWNEIDAIGLMSSGKWRWASKARASSTYAEIYDTMTVAGDDNDP